MNRLTAHFISWIFNPGCLVLGLLVLGVFTSPLTTQALVGWLMTLGLFIVIGLIILLIAWARGVVLDAELMTPVNMADRSQILLVFVSLILIMLIVSFRMHSPQPLHALLVTALLTSLVVAGISNFWKISLHMLGVSTLVTTTLLIGGLAWWPMSLLLPLVAWARLRLKRHTPLQLLAGGLVGFLITAVAFHYYHLI